MHGVYSIKLKYNVWKENIITQLWEKLVVWNILPKSTTKNKEHHTTLEKKKKNSKQSRTILFSKGSVAELKLIANMSFKNLWCKGSIESPLNIHKFNLVFSLAWEYKFQPMRMKTKFQKTKK